MHKQRLYVVWALLVGLAGCGDGESTSTTSVEIRVASFMPGESPVPIEGADVCVLGTEDCQPTNVEGRLTLEVDDAVETAVTITAEGFNPTVSAIEPGVDGERQISMLSEALAEVLSTSLGIDYPPEDRGVVAVTLLASAADPNSGIAGATLGLDDQGALLYYLNEAGLPVFDLSATSRPLGTGGFVEVSPGTREIRLGGSASGCEPLAAWPTAESDRVRAPVVAGYFTDVLLLCGSPD